MSEIELEGAPTRRVLEQAVYLVRRDLDVLYTDKRDDQLTIATQNKLIELQDEQHKSECRDLQGKISRDGSRMRQDERILDFTIMFAVAGWIVAIVAVGYGVWVG